MRSDAATAATEKQDQRNARRGVRSIKTQLIRSGITMTVVAVVVGLLGLSLVAEPYGQDANRSSASASSSGMPATDGKLTTGGKVTKAEVDISSAQTIGSWTWYGYKLSWWETSQIADLSLWNAARNLSSTRLIPYSWAITSVMSVNWVLAARNARSMDQCLAISWGTTGLIVRC